MTKTRDTLNAIITYRMEKSHQDMEAALFAAERNDYSFSGERLYFAAYHMFKGLLLSEGVTQSDDYDVFKHLHQHYVVPGRLTLQEGWLYARLYELRNSHYDEDRYVLTAEDILPLLEPTRAFIAKVEALIKAH